jgi:uncharacterized protein YndB with AHSA1/START domain/ketosteroid isomerase-like protein
MSSTTQPARYTRSLHVRASRARTFDAIATADGVRRWWATTVTGDAAPGGVLTLGFAGVGEQILLRVDAAAWPSQLMWTCIAHSGAEEWAGTTIQFDLSDSGPESCGLRFVHRGVDRELVEAGWDHFLASLSDHLETGSGAPFDAADALQATEETRAVVRHYHAAWAGGRFDEAAALLAEDLVTDVPLTTYPSRDEFAAAVAGFGALVDRVDLVAELADGDDGVLLYDVVCMPIGTLRIAEHFTVTDGRITSIRHVHDTVALRAAGFGRTDG